MIILGIDPGAKGGLAWVEFADNKQYIVSSCPMPMQSIDKLKQEVIDSCSLNISLTGYYADYVVLEWTQARPRQGAVQTMQQGRTFGATEAIIRLHFDDDRIIRAQPKHWKETLGVSKDKSMAVSVATGHFGRAAEKVHWPKGPKGGETIYDGIAEAALLAVYGYRRLAKENKL